jgi:hypothetical protein
LPERANCAQLVGVGVLFQTADVFAIQDEVDLAQAALRRSLHRKGFWPEVNRLGVLDHSLAPYFNWCLFERRLRDAIIKWFFCQVIADAFVSGQEIARRGKRPLQNQDARNEVLIPDCLFGEGVRHSKNEKAVLLGWGEDAAPPC